MTVVAPKTTPKAITIKHLAYEVAEQHKLSNKQGLVLMEDLVELITAHLKKGERVKLAGFGIWVVRSRVARVGRNPATGEPINIKASKKVAFRASKEQDGDLIAKFPRPINGAIYVRALGSLVLENAQFVAISVACCGVCIVPAAGPESPRRLHPSLPSDRGQASAARSRLGA